MPLVMIGDNQVDAFFARDICGADRGDATVDGDDELCLPFVAEGSDRLRVQAVAFVDAVGDVVLDLTAEKLDRMPEDGGRGDAVDVIVAVDDDLFAIAD